MKTTKILLISAVAIAGFAWWQSRKTDQLSAEVRKTLSNLISQFGISQIAASVIAHWANDSKNAMKLPPTSASESDYLRKVANNILMKVGGREPQYPEATY